MFNSCYCCPKFGEKAQNWVIVYYPRVWSVDDAMRDLGNSPKHIINLRLPLNFLDQKIHKIQHEDLVLFVSKGVAKIFIML